MMAGTLSLQVLGGVAELEKGGYALVAGIMSIRAGKRRWRLTLTLTLSPRVHSAV